MASVFIGIDVACAKQKRLPICFARSTNGQLEPVELPKEMIGLIPRGLGNRAVLDANPFVEAATATASAVENICAQMGWSATRVAIDAPAAPSRSGTRQCEKALNAAGLSVFTTPTEEEWPVVLATCRTHLKDGHPLARLPHANKVWMLYGFELFRALKRKNFEVIEVYPFAIVHSLLARHPHKSTDEGFGMQLDVLAARTGWTSSELSTRLRRAVAGTRHDRLDAFMAAWVASLPRGRLEVYGNPGDMSDAVWVPIK